MGNLKACPLLSPKEAAHMHPPGTSTIPGGGLIFSQGTMGLGSVWDIFELKKPQFGAPTLCYSREQDPGEWCRRKARQAG